MSNRRPPQDLILGRLFAGPATRDPEGAKILARALDTLLTGHPDVGLNTPQIIGKGIAEKAGLREGQKPCP